MTAAQRRALEDLLPRYQLSLESHLAGVATEPFANAIAETFGRQAPLALEIGFGNGNALVAMAQTHPRWNCIGVDVYRPGFGALLLACEREEIANVRIVDTDAATFLDLLPPASVHCVNVFFPDPWPKKRHRKRRLVDAAFAAAVANCLEPQGLLSLATDWPDYAEQMLHVLNAEPALHGGIGARASIRPVTPFEAKALAEGRNIMDMSYRRTAGPLKP